MTVISLYCGAGGIDEGLKQAGIKTTLAIDYEPDACNTFKLNHPDAEVICGKVSDYIQSLPRAKIVVGGPPCPEFSRANTERTFDMCEVNNFWQAVGICKPDYYLMENVQDIKDKLWKTNYLINAADYGVPQTRLRRFFTNLKLPSPTHSEYPQQNLFGATQEKWVSIRETLHFEGVNGVLQDRKSTFGEYYKKEDGQFREYNLDKPHSVICDKGKTWLVEVLQKKNPIMFAKHPPSDINGPSQTIVSKDYGLHGNGGLITDGKYARKLTNAECAILQGFPTSYRFMGTKTSVRRQIGNAVPPPITRAFFQVVKI